MIALDNNLKTPIDYFLKWEKEQPNSTFLRQPYGDTWTTMTYAEAGIEARKLAQGLFTIGVEKGDHVALLSKNCYHWILADLAIMMAGCVSVPLYPSLDADLLKVVLDKSDSNAIIVGKLDKWNEDKVAAIGDLPMVRAPHYEGNAKIEAGHDWEALVSASTPIEEVNIPKLDDIWTIIFTSGTTGTPKGVVHTYRNIAATSRNEELNHNAGILKAKDYRFFSFLPLNHIAERAAVAGSAYLTGGSLSFAENLNTFAKNLQDTRPIFFFAVPRIWHKFQQKILAQMPQKKLDRLLKIPIVSGMVKKKIQKALGLQETVCIITGASMTPESLKQWFRNIGLNLREGYGMTENMGALACMPGAQHKANTIGKAVANAQCKIDPDTGEMLLKTPWTMQGYYKEPELTAETIKDGWLHSGDKGIMDDEGFIKIVGRVKDTFKTAKGKFIVPTSIEEKFSQYGEIDQICVAGNGIPQPIALVNLSEEGMKCNKEHLQSSLMNALESVNGKLHGHEKLSSIIITKDIWSDENQMLTPTLKLKRGSINDRYGDRMLSWCEDKECVIWE